MSAAALAWSVTTVAVRSTGHDFESAATVQRSISAQIALIVGVACLLRLFAGRDRVALLTGIAWCLLGISMPLRAAVVPWTEESARTVGAQDVSRVVIVLTVQAVLCAAYVSAAALRHRLQALAAATAAVDVIAVVTGSVPAAMLAELGMAIGWLLLALRVRRDVDGRPGRSMLCAGALLLVATTEAARIAELGAHTVVPGLASGLELMAALLMLAAVVRDARVLGQRRSAYAATVSGRLSLVESRLADTRETERMRLHDARSAAMGVTSASRLLGTFDVGSMDRAALTELIGLELNRLVSMLDSDATEGVCRFDLARALAPVVGMSRLRGTRLDADLPSTVVVGRPNATATALDNVLRNVAAHAPGASARVWARSRCGTVEIVVDDDGPGVPERQRVRLTHPGIRGAGSAGSGLGLHIADAAMREQGGRVDVSASPAGGLRVSLVLPVAVTEDERVAG